MTSWNAAVSPASQMAHDNGEAVAKRQLHRVQLHNGLSGCCPCWSCPSAHNAQEHGSHESRVQTVNQHRQESCLPTFLLMVLEGACCFQQNSACFLPGSLLLTHSRHWVGCIKECKGPCDFLMQWQWNAHWSQRGKDIAAVGRSGRRRGCNVHCLVCFKVRMGRCLREVACYVGPNTQIGIHVDTTVTDMACTVEADISQRDCAIVQQHQVRAVDAFACRRRRSMAMGPYVEWVELPNEMLCCWDVSMCCCSNILLVDAAQHAGLDGLPCIVLACLHSPPGSDGGSPQLLLSNSTTSATLYNLTPARLTVTLA